MLVSVPLFLEYETVLTRPELLLALDLDRELVLGALDYLMGFVEPVRLEYLWRPQLNDPADEMVLETAINGRADYLVTFNDRDFRSAGRFGIRLATPAAFLEVMK